MQILRRCVLHMCHSLVSYLSCPSWPQAHELLVMGEQQQLEQGLREQCRLLEQQIKRGKAYGEWDAKGPHGAWVNASILVPI